MVSAEVKIDKLPFCSLFQTEHGLQHGVTNTMSITGSTKSQLQGLQSPIGWRPTLVMTVGQMKASLRVLFPRGTVGVHSASWRLLTECWRIAGPYYWPGIPLHHTEAQPLWSAIYHKDEGQALVIFLVKYWQVRPLRSQGKSVSSILR